MLDIAELPELKRDLLFRKLDAFVAEVDKARTSLQSVASTILPSAQSLAEGFHNLEPMRRFINSIAALIGIAKDVEDSLHAVPFSTKPLDPPRKQLPAPDDEDIPS